MELESKTVKPYGQEDRSKKEEVAEMFNNISGRYDFLNHFLSLGIDKLWRRKAVNCLKDDRPKKILDLASGTGDFALALLRLKPEEVIGADISDGMLEMGRKKMQRLKVDHIIRLQNGDSENLSFEDNSFDAITVGFGVRNFQDLKQGLKEMHRVLRKDGKVVVLEFSKPSRFPVKQFFGFYSKVIIPFFGKKISKDARAYTYLPESVAAFPEGNDFLTIMGECGFHKLNAKRLSGGIATIYTGCK